MLYFDAIFMKGKLKPLVWTISKNAPISNCGHENLFIMKWENKEEQQLAQKMFLSYIKKNNMSDLFQSDYCLNLVKLFMFNLNDQIIDLEKDSYKYFQEMSITKRAIEIVEDSQILLGSLNKNQKLEFNNLKNQFSVFKHKYKENISCLSIELQEKYNLENKDIFKTNYILKEILQNYEPIKKKKL